MSQLDWISAHPKEVEKYSGKWIAVTDKGIVAVGDSVSEVTSVLRERGIKAMVMKVPRKDEEMSILWSFLMLALEASIFPLFLLHS